MSEGSDYEPREKENSYTKPLQPENSTYNMDAEDRQEMHIEKLLQKFQHQKDYFEVDKRKNFIRKLTKERQRIEKKSQVQDAESPIEIRLEKSMEELEELIRIGHDITTNVKAVHHKRQHLITTNGYQRVSELNGNHKLEALESLAKLNEIESKWTELKEVHNYNAIFSSLHDYRELMVNTLSGKDNLIQQCRAELERVNSFYECTAQKQYHELACIKERFDAQMNLLSYSYKEHIEMLHKAIVDERESIVSSLVEQFNLNMKTSDSVKEKLLAATHAKAQIFSEAFTRICEREQEITHQIRRSIGVEGDMLQLELREIGFKIFKESNQSDYNSLLLRGLCEERFIMRKQQKLRIVKINEAISQLRERLTAQRKENATVIRKLTKHVENLHLSLSRCEADVSVAHKSGAALFKKMWTFNLNEIQPLLSKLLEIDRLAYENTLRVQLDPPKLDLKKFRTYEDCILKDKSSTNLERDQTKKSKAIVKMSPKEKRFLRNIVRILGDRSGGLISEKILKILPTEVENDIIKVSNMLTVIQVSNVSDIESLIDIFRSYSWCPNCSKRLPQETLDKLYKVAKNENKTLKSTTNNVSKRVGNCSDHYLVAEPIFSILCLRDFVESRTQPKKTIQPTDKLPNKAEIIQFWQKFSNCMPPQKVAVWNSLEHAMNHYLLALKERDQLNLECTQLRKQNQELKYFLQDSTYIQT